VCAAKWSSLNEVPHVVPLHGAIHDDNLTTSSALYDVLTANCDRPTKSLIVLFCSITSHRWPPAEWNRLDVYVAYRSNCYDNVQTYLVMSHFHAGYW